MYRAIRATLPAFALGTALLLGGCGLGVNNDDSMSELLASRERIWQQRGPAAYTMNMVRQDQAMPLARPVALQVNNGQVVSATFIDSGEPVPANLRQRFLSVEGLFDLLRDAMNRNVASLSVRYDDDYGFPAEFLIDYDARRTDDDVYVVVSDLHPVP
jgi:hypothetical protein